MLALVALPAAAHHSPAMFDMSGEAVLEGTVTEVVWRNPHVYFGVETVGAGGNPLVQQIEAGSVSFLVVAGVGRESLRAGDRVAVRVKPNRDRATGVVLGWSLTKSDGTTLPLHQRAMETVPQATAEATSLAGTWVPQAAGFVALASAARLWPLTEKGRAAIKETERARIVARSECVSFGPPALMAVPATVIVTVEDSRVTFTLDAGVERVVYLDQDAHPGDLEPSLQGYSIGRWEGDVLVVDTRGYAAHPEGHAFDLPSSPRKHVVERFALTPDRKHIQYDVYVEDPEYFATPLIHRSLWDYRPEQKPSGLPCDPDVARRFVTGE
jgi:hypothetical protein